MAAATVNNRFVAALGPIKMEILNVTASDTNTVTTVIQRPLLALAVNNQDNDAATAPVNASISGKTITLNSTDISSSVVNLLVFGF